MEHVEIRPRDLTDAPMLIPLGTTAMLEALNEQNRLLAALVTLFEAERSTVTNIYPGVRTKDVKPTGGDVGPVVTTSSDGEMELSWPEGRPESFTASSGAIENLIEAHNRRVEEIRRLKAEAPGQDAST